VAVASDTGVEVCMAHTVRRALLEALPAVLVVKGLPLGAAEAVAVAVSRGVGMRVPSTVPLAVPTATLAVPTATLAVPTATLAVSVPACTLLLAEAVAKG